MLIVRNVKVPLSGDFSDIKSLFLSVTGLKFSDFTVKLHKKSVDARDKCNVYFNCAFLLCGDDQKLLRILKRFKPESFTEKIYTYPKAVNCDTRPIVVGFGPAGMFAALSLSIAGLKPIVLERGKDADSRKQDVDAFFCGGELNVNSNIQFGEGGAGTFSDGKLNTGIKDVRIKEVLRVFAEHGAGENILYDSKPHIGTDVLINVVKSIREKIISLGGEVRFQSKLTDIEINNGSVKSVAVETQNNTYKIPCNTLLLCIGHSARDTFLMLKERSVKLEPKPFAVGVRIEHLQEDINRFQYGKFASHPSLTAADYRLATHLENGRGVFTFCMCPGGEVVNASSEQNSVAVNGMSNSWRDGQNANSAVLVGISVEDYYNGDVLDGMYFQEKIEQNAFKAGCGKPVSQTFGDFLNGVPSDNESLKTVIPTAKPNVTMGDITEVLPLFVTDSIKQGILDFDRKLKGFASPDAVLTAPETRSSSPIRILRDENFISSVKGIYPVGEGAGYAGGITSAAVDGLKCAENVIFNLSDKIVM